MPHTGSGTYKSQPGHKKKNKKSFSMGAVKMALKSRHNSAHGSIQGGGI